jgi:hypothetical protein
MFKDCQANLLMLTYVRIAIGIAKRGGLARYNILFVDLLTGDYYG